MSDAYLHFWEFFSLLSLFLYFSDSEALKMKVDFKFQCFGGRNDGSRAKLNN